MGQSCSAEQVIVETSERLPGRLKFAYFGTEKGNMLKARALGILAALEVGQVDYEAVHVTLDDWYGGKVDKFKLSPFGYVAAIELPDGTRVTETTACLQVVGKVGGLNGASAKDFGISSMLACKAAETFSDFTSKGATAVTVGAWNAEKQRAFDAWKPKGLEIIDLFEKLCGEGGAFTSTITTGELALWSMLHQMKTSGFLTTLPPKLGKFYARVEGLPGVQKCLAGQSKMGQLLDYAMPCPKTSCGPLKFAYFGTEKGNMLKARALGILAALEVGQVDYEAVHVTLDDWYGGKVDKFKLSPFGYVAVIELPDGTRVTETTACLQVVGKVGGINGTSDKDFGTSSMLACKAAETFSDFTSKGPTVVTAKDWSKEKQSAFDAWKPKGLETIDQLEKLCGEDGAFTSTVTSGELAVWSMLHQMKTAAFLTTLPPKLGKFYARVEGLPGVQRCLAGQSKMGQLLDYAAPCPKV